MTSAQKRRLKFAVAIAGAVLAVVCKALPPDYQGPCETIVHVCTGGF